MRKAKRIVACSVADLPPGERKIISVRGRSIGVFNYEGSYYAVHNICPHHKAPLCMGQVGPEMRSPGVGKYELKPGTPIISCPWHSYEFDMESGHNLGEPERYRVKTYETKAEGDEVVIYM